MKLRTEERSVEVGGVVASQKFSMSMDAHMMDILSGLYSDIPWAIVREYWSNAEDGHDALIVTGKKPRKPIQIHVPNNIEPWFAVRDYGIGMDHDTVFQIYTQYCNSTKNTSNVQKGGFGLGAKVAFCYPDGADQWTIDSWYEGVHRGYVAAKDSHGMPTLQLMAEVPSDEPSGIRVKIPVAQKDIGVFVSAVRRFAKRRHEHKFTIVGDQGNPQEYVPLKYTTKTDKYGWRPQGSGEHGMMAVMGGVPYPVTLTNADLDLSSEARQFLGQQGSVDMFFEIGELDIVPAREGLKYTTHTIGKLLERLPGLFQERVKDVLKDLSKCENHWDAVQFCQTNKNALTLAKSSLGGNHKVTWSGYPIDSATPLLLKLQDVQDELSKRTNDQSSIARIIHVQRRYNDLDRHPDIVPIKSLPVAKDGTIDLMDGRDTGKPVRTELTIDKTMFERASSVTLTPFMFADVKGHVALFSAWIKKHGSYGINDFYLIVGENLTAVTLGSALGGIQIDSLNDRTVELQKVKEAKKIKAREPASLQVLNGGYWRQSEVDLNKGGYYVPLFRGSIDDDSRSVPDGIGTPTFNKLVKILPILAKQGLIGDPKDLTIVGVPRTRLKSLESTKNWENLWVHIKPLMLRLCNRAIPETLQDPNELRNIIDKLSGIKAFTALGTPNCKPLMKLVKVQTRMTKEFEDYQKRLDLFQDVVAMRRMVQGNTKGKVLKRAPKGVDTKALLAYNEWLQQRYPLLFMDYSSYRWVGSIKENKQAFTNYIHMVDKTTPVRNAPKL